MNTSSRFIAVLVFSTIFASCLSDSDDGGRSTSTGGDTSGTTGDASGDGICTELCPEIMDLDCPVGPPSLDDCVSVCEGSCHTERDAVVACAGSTPYSCGPNGDVTTRGCETESIALAACYMGASPVCVESCFGVLAADCANGPPTLTDCVFTCEDAYDDCPAEMAALEQCTGDSAYACGSQGEPTVAGCETEMGNLYDCL